MAEAHTTAADNNKHNTDNINDDPTMTQGFTEGSPLVRFASNDEEIEPIQLDSARPERQFSGQTEAQLRELSESLSGTHLQSRRMSHFNFEPVSLPTSRVREIHTPPPGSNFLHKLPSGPYVKPTASQTAHVGFIVSMGVAVRI
jgi:hypothetical protein